VSGPHAADATPGPRLPYGEGIYRRAFLLVGGEGRVVAEMEDDFHRFRVTLEHDGARVTRVAGEAFRYPWTECPGATVVLAGLAGMPLATRLGAAAEHADPRANCTHLFDTAALAVVHAAAGRARRRYDVEVPDRRDGRTRARLRRDGRPLLDWELDGERIVAPEPFAGRVLRGSAFLRFAERELDPERAEAAIVLRRACAISAGRARDLDLAPHAGVYMSLAAGSCHSFTPGIAERALRVRGTTRDFTHRPEALLAEPAAVGG
jgi:hypothetical protein